MNGIREGSVSSITGHELYILLFFACIAVFCYSITTIYGMIVFAKKMYILTQLRQSSVNPFADIDDENNNGAKLNKEQIKLLNTTAKYISLLSLAILTSWCTFAQIVAYIPTANLWGEFGRQIIRVQYSLDCTINILCLYLQYPFAEGLYNKYCKCLGNFWLFILRRNAEKKMNHKNRESMVENEIGINMVDVVQNGKDDNSKPVGLKIHMNMRQIVNDKSHDIDTPSLDINDVVTALDINNGSNTLDIKNRYSEETGKDDERVNRIDSTAL